MAAARKKARTLVLFFCMLHIDSVTHVPLHRHGSPTFVGAPFQLASDEQPPHAVLKQVMSSGGKVVLAARSSGMRPSGCGGTSKSPELQPITPASRTSASRDMARIIQA